MRKILSEEERVQRKKQSLKRAKDKYRLSPGVKEMERQKRVEYLSRPEVQETLRLKRSDPAAKERQKIISFKWRENNLEYSRQQCREYARKNKERVRLEYFSNPEKRKKILERQKEYAKRLDVKERLKAKNAVLRKTEEYKKKKRDQSKRLRLNHPEYVERDRQYNIQRRESGRAQELERARRKKLRDEGVVRQECAKHRARRSGAYISKENVLPKTVFNRDRWKCVYCGIKVVSCKENAPNQATIDHFIPIKKGGSHTYENMRTACRSCNVKKNDNMPEGAQLTIFERV